MFKEVTYVGDKTYVVDDKDNVRRVNNNQELYDILTLKNKLEFYNHYKDELRDKYLMLQKKYFRNYDRITLYLIVYLVLIIYFTCVLGNYFYIFLASLFYLGIAGLTRYKSYKINKEIEKIKKYLANIETDYSKAKDDLWNKYRNLNSENISLYFDDCLVNHEEYDNIKNKHIVSIETDFSQDYDKTSGDVKVRRREKKSGNIGERR